MQFSDAHSRVTNGSVGLDPIRAWKKTDLVRMMTAIDCGRKIERQNNNSPLEGPGSLLIPLISKRQS